MTKFTILAGAPEGYDALVIAEAVTKSAGLHLHIARDDLRAATLAEALNFFAPKVPVLMFPGWFQTRADAPQGFEVMGQRMMLVIGQGLVVMSFNCGGPATRLTPQRLLSDVGPRLAAMVREVRIAIESPGKPRAAS